MSLFGRKPKFGNGASPVVAATMPSDRTTTRDHRTHDVLAEARRLLAAREKQLADLQLEREIADELGFMGGEVGELETKLESARALVREAQEAVEQASLF